MIWIVDTSVIIKWFVHEIGHDKALYIIDSNQPLFCPDFALSEAANVLWRNVKNGNISDAQMLQALDVLPAMFDSIIPSSELLIDAVKIAGKLDHSVYDCMFLAASFRYENANLVSADEKFLKKVVSTYDKPRVTMLKDVLPSPEQLESYFEPLRALSAAFFDTVDMVKTEIIKEKDLPIFNTQELRPAFDSPAYIKLKQAVLSVPSYEMQCIMATCWLGQQRSMSFENHLSHSHMRITNIEADLNYIISKLILFDRGIDQLKLSKNKSMEP